MTQARSSDLRQTMAAVLSAMTRRAVATRFGGGMAIAALNI